MSNPNYGSVAASVAYQFQPELATGRATMTVPLVVPAGVRGIAPQLALLYQSDGGPSMVGYGWRLELGSIHRDLKEGVPTYETTDPFFLSFQDATSELVSVGHGAYRLKDEGAFVRITFTPAGWKVWDKSGTTYTFGSSANSQTTTPSGTFEWHLDRIEDVLGNNLEATYGQDGGATYLKRIRYAGNRLTGFAPPYRVEFVMESRPDVTISYRIGSKVTTALRLARVEVYVGDQLIRAYRFGYTISPDSNRSLLSSITQVGSDGSSTLPPVTFYYSTNPGGWKPDNAWAIPDGTFVRNHIDQGRRLADLNGDGLIDLAVGNGSASRRWELTAWINTGAGWVRNDAFIVPTGLFVWEQRDDGRYLVDLNGDGRPEALAAVAWTDGSFKSAWETVQGPGGWGWQRADRWLLPDGWFIYSGSYVADQGRRFADFNGDARADVLAGQDGTLRAYLNTGSGWRADETWRPPEPFVQSDRESGLQLVDLNGDGLTDLIRAADGARLTYLNTGHGWTQDPRWNVPADADFVVNGQPRGVAIVDLNGDGQPDLLVSDSGQRFAYLNTGSGWRRTTQWILPDGDLIVDGHDQGRRLIDVNGDGLVDLMVGLDDAKATFLSTGAIPDLLMKVTNGLGGTTTITYAPSTQYDNRGADGLPKLPLVVQTVSTVTVDDGLGHRSATTYRYQGGVFDPASREFRGFREARVIDPEGHVAITRFLQDDIFKARPYEEEHLDHDNRRLLLVQHEWRSKAVAPGVTFAYLFGTTHRVYDGQVTAKATRVEYEYDDDGNQTKIIEYGDLDTSGDERQTWIEYAYNPTAWIMDTPARRFVTDAANASGRMVSQSWFYYDGHASLTEAPTQGLLTKEVRWREDASTNPQTTMAYDEYGNVVRVTDALDRTTTTMYDATYHAFPIQVVNPLGHTLAATYDPKTGHALTRTDQNGVTTTSGDDVFGRLIRIIGPNDTAALPTVSYAYELSTVPTRTTVRTRIASGQPEELASYTFTDGVGRTIQTRSPAEDPTKQVVTGVVEFDSRGLVAKQWGPYLSNTSTVYVPVSQEPTFASLAAVAYTYDPMGRTLTITDPDRSVTSTSYHDWVVTVTDANGHKTIRTSDAYGRLRKVEELNQGATYTTTYQYDAKNNLTKVTDHLGHITTITYDSLNRKLSMDDPDMGRWTYAYDAVDNLTQQTDARGVTISFTYDALNRLIRKEYADASLTSHLSPVTYTYDNPAKSFAKGKLTEIADGSGSSSFEYDNLGRLITETKTIDGQPSTIHRTYDLLGRLTSLTYPDTELVSYTYNPQGGIKTITGLKGGVTTAYVSNINYNAAGQLTKLVYGNGTISDYTYNPQTLRLSSFITQHPSSGVLQDFTYQFDAVGNVTGIQDAVHTASQTFGYDDLNRLTLARGAYGTFPYAYDPIGNMIEKEGVTMRYGLPDRTKPHAVTSTSSGVDLTYDATGNLTKKSTGERPQFTGERAPSTDWTARYLSYDAENRLTQVTTDAPTPQTVTLSLAPGWNLFCLPVVPSRLSIPSLFGASLIHVTQLLRFNPSTGQWDRYVNDPASNPFDTVEPGRGYAIAVTAPITLSLTGPPASGSIRLVAGTHLIGNPTPTPRTVAQVLNNLVFGVDVTAAWRYNGTGFVALSQTDTVAGGEALVTQLAAAKTWQLPGNATTTQFVYDGDGGRVKLITPAGTTIYIGPVYELRNGQPVKHILRGTDLVASVEGGAVLYRHEDHLGSTNLVTNGTGQVRELAEYTPYGMLSRHEGPVDLPQKFTGHRLDGTGLVFMGARYYDPALGRFISADPTIQQMGDPQDLNRYAYARNNPLRYIDPSGYGWFKKFWRKLGKAAVAAVMAVATVVVASLPGGQPLAAAMLAKTALAAAGASVVLDTGTGRKVQTHLAKEVFDDVFGMRPRTAAFAAGMVSHAVVSSAFYIGLTTAFPTPNEPGGTAEQLKEGARSAKPGRAGGPTVGQMERVEQLGLRNARTELTPGGKSWIGSYDVTLGNPVTDTLTSVLGIRHAAVSFWQGGAVADSGQAILTGLPFNLYMSPWTATSHQAFFNSLIQAGHGGLQALQYATEYAGWSFYLTSSVYGVNGAYGVSGIHQGLVNTEQRR